MVCLEKVRMKLFAFNLGCFISLFFFLFFPQLKLFTDSQKVLKLHFFKHINYLSGGKKPHKTNAKNHPAVCLTFCYSPPTWACPICDSFFHTKKKAVNITQGFCSQVPKSSEGQILPYGPCSLFLWSWTLFLIHLGHWRVHLKSKGSWWPMLGSQAIPIPLSLLLSHPDAGLKLTLRVRYKWCSQAYRSF